MPHAIPIALLLVHINYVVGLPAGFYLIDPSQYEVQLRDDYAWAVQNVPFIDLPDVAPYNDVVTAYYYRWRSFRKHIVDTPEGYVVTEFLMKVGWAGMYNTIPAAAGHHIKEGSWIHNATYIDDYIKFWFVGSGEPRKYTSWITWSAYQRSWLNGDTTLLDSLLPALVENLEGWVKQNLGHYEGRTCFWQGEGNDAMEVSISGSGCRPTINAVLYGEAAAVAEIAEMSSSPNRTAYLNTSETLRELSRAAVLAQWNPSINLFAVVPLPSPSNVVDTVPVCPGNGSAKWPENEPAGVRELLGYMPWYFSDPPLLSSQMSQRYISAWEQLFDDQGFAAPYGLRTAELRSPCYNYSWAHRDCWNGPSWPYETARVLTSFANILNDPSVTPGLNASQYNTLLQQYARQHIDTYAVNDTAVPLRSGHIFEVLHPDDGYWIDRDGLKEVNSSLWQMGDDYNHSTFVDLILSGLFGIRAQRGNVLLLNPLFTHDILYFAVDHVLYKKRILSILYDASGKHYNKGQGLFVYVDGVQAAHSSSIAKLTVDLDAF